MKIILKMLLAAVGLSVVLAGGLPAVAAPQDKPAGLDSAAILSTLSKLDLSGNGIFADAPSFSDIQAPAAVPGAPLPGAAAKPAGENDRSAPDWSFTPGRLCKVSDPDFKEYRYAEHIPYCRRDVTSQMKQEVAAHYNVPQSDWSNYEFDHLIPLCIGGDSRVDNLWPQPHNPSGSDGSEAKDKLEDELYHQLAAGTITQADAVRQIYAWFGVAPQLPNMPGPAVMTAAR